LSRIPTIHAFICAYEEKCVFKKKKKSHKYLLKLPVSKGIPFETTLLVIPLFKEEIVFVILSVSEGSNGFFGYASE